MNRIDLSKPYHWFFLAMCLLTIPIVILCIATLFVGGFFGLLFWGWIMCEIWEGIESDSLKSKAPKTSYEKAPSGRAKPLW